MYYYNLLLLDTNGNKYHYNAEDEPSQFHAVTLAEEWMTQGDVNVEVDSVTVLATNDPRWMGIWSPNNDPKSN
jgi:hypothetical protein